MRIMFVKILIGLTFITNLSCRPRITRPSQDSQVRVAGGVAKQDDFPFAVALSFATRTSASGKTELVSEPERHCVADEGPEFRQDGSYLWDSKRCTRYVYCSGSLYVRPDGSGPVKLVTAAHCLRPQLKPEHIRLSIGSNTERFLSAYPLELKAHPQDKPEPIRERFRFDIAKSNLSGGTFPAGVYAIRLADPSLSLPTKEISDRLAAEVMMWRESQDLSTLGRNPQSSLRRLAEVLPAVYVGAFGVSNEGLSQSDRDEGRLRSLHGMIAETDRFNASSDLFILPKLLEEGICSGDSGGAIFVRTNETDPYAARLIGVVGSGLKEKCRGTLVSAANVLQHGKWLEE